MDIFKSNIVVGVGAAVAATLLAPVLIPVVASVGRPLAKALIRGGMLFYEKSREAVALAGEAMEDMMAEIQSEDAGRGAAMAAPRPAPAEAAPPYGGNGQDPARPDAGGAQA